MSGRLPDSINGEFPEGYDENAVCYWRYVGGDPREWTLNIPGGDLANLSRHEVTEHVDGTISVTPSILVTRGNRQDWRRHGYLVRGKWEPCSDDCPPADGRET